MKVGIGVANTSDAFSAGKTAAREALAQAGVDRSDLVLAFCSGELDHHRFFEGLKAVLGDGAPVIGGSAVGIITRRDIRYDGHPSGAAVIWAEDLSVSWAAAGEVDRDEYRAGQELGKKISPGPKDRIFLMFYDSIKVPATGATPPIMNASPPLIRGIEEALSSEAPIIGSGVLGHMDFQPTFQFCGDRVERQHVAGALLGGDFSVYTRIMHGCTPHDGVYRTVTRSQGALIYELDGKPIVPIIDDLYGGCDWQTQIPVRRLTLGVNHGEKFDDFKEENYVNRLIAGVLPDKEGIVIFEPDLEAGTQIQFMLRDPQAMIRSAEQNTQALLEQIAADAKTPVFGLYIDCAGRNARFSDTLEEEAAKIVDAMNRARVPLLGFYSGVEVAPLLGKSRGLDWTGVLTVFAR